jgi:subtilisin family serine protease
MKRKTFLQTLVGLLLICLIIAGGVASNGFKDSPDVPPALDVVEVDGGLNEPDLSTPTGWEITFKIESGPGELPESAKNATPLGKTLPSLVNWRFIRFQAHQERAAEAVFNGLSGNPRITQLELNPRFPPPPLPPHTNPAQGVFPEDYTGDREKNYWAQEIHSNDPNEYSEFGEGYDLESEQAWYHTTGDEDTLIAMIDTGVQMVDGNNETLADIGNMNISFPTFCDLVYPWYNDPCDEDETSHGTASATVMIAPLSDQYDSAMVGVCPDCSVISYDIYGAAFSWTMLATGIDDAVNEGADVIMVNFSYNYLASPYGCTDLVTDAIDDAWDAGVLVIVAAHNDGNIDPDESDGSAETLVRFPARYHAAFGVSAVDLDGEIASWDPNWDPIFAPFFAQGTGVYALSYDVDPESDTYEEHISVWYGGTSSATPITAAVAGLLLSEDPTLTPGELWTVLKEGGQYSKWLGTPLLSAHGSLNYLDNTTNIPEYEPPFNDDHACSYMNSTHYNQQSWWENVVVANPDSSTRSLNLKGFDSGSTWDTDLDIPAEQWAIFHPGYMHSPTCGTSYPQGCRFAMGEQGLGDTYFHYPWAGGWEVDNDSSGDDNGAIVVLHNNKSGYAGGGVESSTGAATAVGSFYLPNNDDASDLTLHLPIFKNDFYGNTSEVVLYNTSDSIAYVTATYWPLSGNSKGDYFQIPPNETITIVPDDVGIPSCNGSGGDTCVGSATFYTGGPSQPEDRIPIWGYVRATKDRRAGLYVGYGETEWVKTARLVTDGEMTNEAFVPGVKLDFYDTDTGSSVYNPSTSSKTYNLDFYVKAVESGCSASVGDTATDTVTVPGRKYAIVARWKNNVGSLPSCVSASMKVSHASADVAVMTGESKSTAGTYAATISSPEGAPQLVIPLYKEDAGERQGGMTFMNTSSTCSKLNLTFYELDGDEYLIQTDELCQNEGVNIRRVSDGASGKPWTQISGGTPDDETTYMVVADRNTSPAKFVGQYNEADYGSSGFLDKMINPAYPVQ